MWKYFRALGYFITGRFSKAAAALQENEYVMAATYDASIQKGVDRFNTVKNAVAELINVTTTRTNEIKALSKGAEELGNVKAGAKMAMQKRIDTLKAAGKSKEDIQADTEFVRHLAAFNDADSTLAEKQERISEKEADLKIRQGQLATYKAELQKMQRANEALKSEKQEAIADVAIAKQSEAINSVIAGISTESSDKDLESVREARKRAVSRATVTAELVGNDAKVAQNEYLKYATQAKSTAELDGMLNWGEDAPKKELEPARIPE